MNNILSNKNLINENTSIDSELLDISNFYTSVENEFNAGNFDDAIRKIKNYLYGRSFSRMQILALERAFYLDNESVVEVCYINNKFMVLERTEKQQLYYKTQIHRFINFIE